MMFDDAVTEMRFRAAVYSIGNLPMFICLFETVFQLGFILRFQFQLTCTVCTAIANASRMYKPSWPVCLSGEVGAFGTCKPTALISVYLGHRGPQGQTYSGTKWAGGMQFIWHSLRSNWNGQQARN